jgi:hypothetical protein
MHQSVDSKHVMCIECRATYTDAELKQRDPKDAHVCPRCGSRHMAADLNDSKAITLSALEWRILFFWASSHAASCVGDQGDRIITGITNRVREQWPDSPTLNLKEELQQLADQGYDVSMYDGDKVVEFHKRTLN